MDIRYFEGGYIETKVNYIHKIDPYTETLQLYKVTGLSNVNLLDIVEIK
ncbi:hypothetical protein [Staphylococcus ureilyticus]|nr:hypothetical protein [Staphylococcus ureilyticus]